MRAALVGTSDFALNASAAPGMAYPLDLDFTLQREDEYFAPFDAAGIPVRRYRSVGDQYNPTRIAGYALAQYDRFLQNGDSTSRDKFLKMAAWFMFAEDALWHYRFDWGALRAPWLSGMAQGQGASVLVRAFLLTEDSSFMEQAIRAMVPLTKDISAGGVRSKIDGRWHFLEEYPTAEPAHTLNGYLFAVVGIMDVAAFASEVSAQVGFDELIRTLDTQCERWDLGYWSAYDLHVAGDRYRNPATVNYHRIHMHLGRYIGERLRLENLVRMVDKWYAQHDRRRCRLRALQQKVAYRVLAPPQR